MPNAVTTRPILDWLGRPYVELQTRVANLRRAAQGRVDQIIELLGEREALLGHPASPAPADLSRSSSAELPAASQSGRAGPASPSSAQQVTCSDCGGAPSEQEPQAAHSEKGETPAPKGPPGPSAGPASPEPRKPTGPPEPRKPTRPPEPPPVRSATRPPEPPGRRSLPGRGANSESLLGTRHLDLRVRSTLVRDGTMSAMRQEMADIVSFLGLYRQLDPVSDCAYEVIAGAENLLALARGEGWVFAHRDILQTGADVDEAVAAYCRELHAAHDELERRSNKLSQLISNHHRRYNLARFGILVLLFLGPLTGLWSGLQLGYGKAAPTPPKILVPKKMEQIINVLSRSDHLVAQEGRIAAAPWKTEQPGQRLDLLAGQMKRDLSWAMSLCERLSRVNHGEVRQVLLPQCWEAMVRWDQAQRTVAGTGDELREQDRLRVGLLNEALSTIPSPTVAPQSVDDVFSLTHSSADGTIRPAAGDGGEAPTTVAGGAQ